FWDRLDIYRRQKLRQTSTSNTQVRPWRPDLNGMASIKPGVIQFALKREVLDGGHRACQQRESRQAVAHH
ncbi:hypothetical protein, partial [Halopseudomonas bauzanensis]|uniref:hypothetical protein n=1 Tax=Halopseudomonas bauzanensis TaxID=653930 RepID=UPI001B7FE783